MPIKAKTRFEGKLATLTSGETIEIPDPLYRRLVLLIKAYDHCKKKELTDFGYALGTSFELLFLHHNIPTKCQSLKELKSFLTFNQKKAIPDIRKKDDVLTKVHESNQKNKALKTQLEWYNSVALTIEDCERRRKAKKAEYVFRLAQRECANISKSTYDTGDHGLDYNDFLASDYWQNVKIAVFTRDRWHCQHCGAVIDLQVHHKTYENHFDEKNHLSDLITLCKRCHYKEHRKRPMRRSIPERFNPNPLIVDFDL